MASRGRFFSYQPLLKAFLLTLALSWGIWLMLAPHGSGHARLLALPLLTVAAASPALVALLVSAPGGRRCGVGLVVPAAFIISWILFLAMTAAATLSVMDRGLPQNRIYTLLLLLACGLQAAVPAGIVAASFAPDSGARRLLASVRHPRKRLAGWYLLAALLMPAVGMLGVLLTRLLGHSAITLPAGLTAGAAGLYFLNGLVYTTLGVEVGWRAFALPRLQRGLSPLAASLLLAASFLVWQLPLYLVPLATGSGPDVNTGLTQFMGYGVNIFLLTLLLTWLYNRSGGSILATGLMHTSFIVVVRLLPAVSIWHLLLLAAALLVVGADRMWQRRPCPDVAGALTPAAMAARWEGAQ
jgi:membrane protease YdiL (CAAX protease family)